MWRRMYNGTFSHSDKPGHKSPQDMSKGEFAALVVYLFAKEYGASQGQSNRKRARTNKLAKLAVFAERHKSGKPHFHFPLFAEHQWNPAQLKAALRACGVYVEFSAEHDYYWTAIVYCSVPGDSPDGKKEEDLDPDPWLSDGHASIRETLEDMPRGARATDKGRVRRFLGLTAGGPLTNAMAMADKQFAQHVVELKLRNEDQLLAWVRTGDLHKGNMTIDEHLTHAGLQAYCSKNQLDLSRRIAFAWRMEQAPQVVSRLRMTAWDVVVAADDPRSCVCGGKWIPMTEELLAIHCAHVPWGLRHEAPHSAAVRSAMCKALKMGADKYVNLFFYGPKTSGKSHCMKPLIAMFKEDAFTRSVGKGNYPLQDIFGKKICVLQDIRTETYKLAWDSLLVWWEGESFRVPLPQNGQHMGDKLYEERAPVFATSGSKLRISAAEAHRSRLNEQEQNEMMDARFKFFCFPVSVPENKVIKVEPCPACFAKWVRDASPPPGHALLPEVDASRQGHAQTAAEPSFGRTAGGTAFLDRLRQLGELKAAGILDDDEFRAAKHLLLGLA